MTKKITTLVSVCSAKDVDVWSIAAFYIIKNIAVDRYFLFVPDDEIALFRQKTPKNFEIIGDRSLCGSLIDDLRIRIAGKVENRIGWYLQQLVKLCALYMFREDDLVIIWDADTVPLKPISFVSKEGKILHYSGTEYNRPYFDTIWRLLGMERKVGYSFIAQSFAMKGTWIDHFVKYVETHNGKHWKTAILDAIDFEHGTSFSEYETLGTFATNFFQTEMSRSPGRWYRFGNSAIGSVRNLEHPANLRRLADYDFVSFEAWDAPKAGFTAALRRIKRRFKIFI
jgi:hypothetical protein